MTSKLWVSLQMSQGNFLHKNERHPTFPSSCYLRLFFLRCVSRLKGTNRSSVNIPICNLREKWNRG